MLSCLFYSFRFLLHVKSGLGSLWKTENNEATDESNNEDCMIWLRENTLLGWSEAWYSWDGNGFHFGPAEDVWIIRNRFLGVSIAKEKLVLFIVRWDVYRKAISDIFTGWTVIDIGALRYSSVYRCGGDVTTSPRFLRQADRQQQRYFNRRCSQPASTQFIYSGKDYFQRGGRLYYLHSCAI